MRRVLSFIPRWLAHPVHLAFLLGLLGYIVIYAGIETLVFKNPGAVSTNVQLIAGNWTNVTSALGGSIAAGASSAGLVRQQRHHQEVNARLDELHDKHDALHAKIGADIGREGTSPEEGSGPPTS